MISASHSKKFSSSTGPAMIPSGGFKVNSKKDENINQKQIEIKLCDISF